MNEMNTVDARGLSCPEPAMLARQALQKLGKGQLKVIVDNRTARDNVTRIGNKLGWTVNVDKISQDEFQLSLQK
jgi:TusA-related sulfurtransferase